jgi:hypothetical protein
VKLHSPTGKPLELCPTGYQYRPEHLLSRDLCFPMMAGGGKIEARMHPPPAQPKRNSYIFMRKILRPLLGRHQGDLLEAAWRRRLLGHKRQIEMARTVDSRHIEMKESRNAPGNHRG